MVNIKIEIYDLEVEPLSQYLQGRRFIFVKTHIHARIQAALGDDCAMHVVCYLSYHRMTRSIRGFWIATKILMGGRLFVFPQREYSVG